jgi:hypothetical protein
MLLFGLFLAAEQQLLISTQISIVTSWLCRRFTAKDFCPLILRLIRPLELRTVNLGTKPGQTNDTLPFLPGNSGEHQP